MCVCVCVAKPVAVELRCHATALIFFFFFRCFDILFCKPLLHFTMIAQGHLSG